MTSLLKLDGTLTLVGAPEQPLPLTAFNLLLPRRNFAGSAIGGIAETQEMLDFCAVHGIVSDIELIPMQKINEAWDRLIKQDVRHRFDDDTVLLALVELANERHHGHIGRSPDRPAQPGAQRIALRY